MMYENHKIKLLIPSILFLLLGVAFMVYPADSMIMLVRITGAFLILLGIVIFIPTLRDRAMLGFRFWLLVVLSIIIVIFGVILAVRPGYFVEAFWITLGIILILDGIKNLMYLPVLPFKLVNVILSVVSIICGVLILIHPFGTGLASMVLVGAFFAYSGVAGIVLSIMSKIKGRQIAEMIDAAETAAADYEVIDEDAADGDEPDVETDDSEKAAEKPDIDDDEADPYERDSVLPRKKK